MIYVHLKMISDSLITNLGLKTSSFLRFVLCIALSLCVCVCVGIQFMIKSNILMLFYPQRRQVAFMPLLISTIIVRITMGISILQHLKLPTMMLLHCQHLYTSGVIMLA
jgi:hypothetical protein